MLDFSSSRSARLILNPAPGWSYEKAGLEMQLLADAGSVTTG